MSELTLEQKIQSALDDIHKEWGDTSVMKLGDKPEMDVEVISTGNIGIDLALGVGGLPKGRIVEVFGPESSGKTTLTLHVLGSAQQSSERPVAFVDAEHALDPRYARALGINVDEMYISQPDYGEQALSIVDKLVASGGFSVVVVDSVAALTPKSELEGDMGDANVGKQARMMSQALRKITANANRTKTTVIFINQLREKIGVMFGSPETTTGGRALKFYSTIRIDTRKRDATKDKATGDFSGNEVDVKIVKNKVAPPLKTVRLNLYYGEGFSEEASLLNIGADLGVIPKKGAWYYDMDGEAIGQGLEKARLALKENPDLKERIRKGILEVGQIGFGEVDEPRDVQEEGAPEEVAV